MYTCIDTRPCFARLKKRMCHALSETYEHDGECPFCKEYRDVTEGKTYPMKQKEEMPRKT